MHDRRKDRKQIIGLQRDVGGWLFHSIFLLPYYLRIHYSLKYNPMSAIEDNEYKPDFEILDRYLKFSSELLRISLLAIGGFGTIVLVKLKGEESAGSLTNLTFLF